MEGFLAFRNIMTVHSPPSTSLGTRRSDDDDIRLDFPEVQQIFREGYDGSQPPKHESWDEAK
jgi:hypothetical protein